VKRLDSLEARDVNTRTLTDRNRSRHWPTGRVLVCVTSALMAVEGIPKHAAFACGRVRECAYAGTVPRDCAPTPGRLVPLPNRRASQCVSGNIAKGHLAARRSKRSPEPERAPSTRERWEIA